MRRPALLPLLILAAGLAAGPAGAQTSKPRPDTVRPPAKAVLLPTPVSRPPAFVSLAPPPRLTLTGLPPVGDAAPACRAQCTKARVYCEAAGDDCTPRWSDCLAVCRAPPAGVSTR